MMGCQARGSGRYSAGRLYRIGLALFTSSPVLEEPDGVGDVAQPCVVVVDLCSGLEARAGEGSAGRAVQAPCRGDDPQGVEVRGNVVGRHDRRDVGDGG